MKYFQSLDNPNNKAVRRGLQGEVRATSVIGDVTQAAYLGPWLWKAAVEKAESFDVDKVVAASPGIELNDGAGRLREDPREPSPVEQDAHRPDARKTVSSRCSTNPDLIEPDPFPKGYQ